jgi:hypothetical protein
VHETDQPVLLHLGRTLISHCPHVLDVLPIQTAHRLPLEHVVLGAGLELGLLARLQVEGRVAADGLRVEVRERGTGRSLLDGQTLLVLEELGETAPLDLHLLVYLPADFLPFLVDVGHLVLGLLLGHCLLLAEEGLLAVLPVVLQVHPVDLVREQPLRLFQQLASLLSVAQQEAFGNALNLGDHLLIVFSDYDGVFGSLVGETEAEDESLQHDDLAEEGVVELQLQQLEVLQEFQRLAVVLRRLLRRMVAEVALHLPQRHLQLLQPARQQRGGSALTHH